MEPSSSKRIGLVIPVLNAERHLNSLLPALQRQTLQPDRFIVMDSQSDDCSAERFGAAGAEIVTVQRSEFDHGSTRQRAAELLSDCDILIYLTQDAYPDSDESFAKIVAAFDDPKVGVAYGRQLPHKDATPISAHARLFNYPPTSCSVTIGDRHALGIRTCFCSDSFAAYRYSALVEVGGFSDAAPVGEEVLVTAMMLKQDWTKRYAADAQVFHSHGYTVLAELRRAFDIGVFHSNAPWLGELFGGASGEGRRFVISELRYLARLAPLLIGSALARTGAKAIGYGLGKRNRFIPLSIKKYLSLHRDYWDKQNQH
jgi:rhamnosyltransferase